MNVLPTQWFGERPGESGIVLAGVLLTTAGLLLQDTLGVTTMLTAVGIALVVASAAFLLAEGTNVFRGSLAFGALVGAQLLPFSGVVRLMGLLLLVAVLFVAILSRS
jgi:predicted ABC-type sugar transport system permease subunit